MMSSSFGGNWGFSRTSETGVRFMDGVEDDGRTVALKGKRAAGHLVENGAKGKEILRASSSLARACSGDI